MKTRRSLLAALGCAATAPTVGCIESPLKYLDSGPKLAQIALSNFSDSSQPFEIRIQRNDAVVHRSTHTLEEGESVAETAEACHWMETAGSYIIEARIRNGEWVSQPVDESVNGRPEYVSIHVAYDAWNNDRITFLIEQSEKPDTNSSSECLLTSNPQNR